MKITQKKWSDITVGQWFKIEEARKAASNEDDFVQRCICIAYGITADALAEQPIADTLAMAEGIRFLNASPKPRLVRRHYTLGDKVYTCCLNPQELTTAQYMDFQTLARTAGERPERILSVLLIPEGSKYAQGYMVEDVQEAIRQHLSIVDAISLTAFFLTLSARSMSRRVSALRRECRRMARKARRQGLTEMAAALRNLEEVSLPGGGSTR